MYSLYLSDGHYIEGKKIGRSSKSIDTLKKRALKELKVESLHFDDQLDSDSKCIWIDQGEMHTPVGLIKPVEEKKSTRAESKKD